MPGPRRGPRGHRKGGTAKCRVGGAAQTNQVDSHHTGRHATEQPSKVDGTLAAWNVQGVEGTYSTDPGLTLPGDP